MCTHKAFHAWVYDTILFWITHPWVRYPKENDINFFRSDYLNKEDLAKFSL